MVVSLGAALAAAAAFGVAAVLQGLAVSTVHPHRPLDPRLLLRLLHRPTFLAAVALNLGGFVLHVVALQGLPLFFVQAVIAASVALTAVLAGRLLHVPLERHQWGAVACVVVGLALLGSAAAGGKAVERGLGVRLGVLAALVAAGLCAWLVGRVCLRHRAALLGLVAGVGFGLVAVCARLLPDLRPATVATDLATPVLAASGTLAFLVYSAAMQAGSVTTATGALVVTQTGVPAVVGVLVLGDQVRDGWHVPALLGLVLAVVGAAALARFEHVETVLPAAPAAPRQAGAGPAASLAAPGSSASPTATDGG